MAIKLSEWKERTKQATLPTHSFEVVCTPPVSGFNGDELVLRTEQALLPGTAYFSVDNFSPYGNGKMYNIPYRYIPQEISMTHIVDKDGLVLLLMQEWSQKVTDKIGFDKYGAKYMFGDDGYAIDMDINVLDREGNRVKQYKLLEIYPQVIEPIQLGWGQTDEYMKLNVQYRFSHFEMDSDTGDAFGF